MNFCISTFFLPYPPALASGLSAFNHKEKKAGDESFSLLQFLELHRRKENKELDCNSGPAEQKKMDLEELYYLMLNINMIAHVALGCIFH